MIAVRGPLRRRRRARSLAPGLVAPGLVVHGLLVLVVAVAGAWAGATLAPPTRAYVGPLEAEIRVSPSTEPGLAASLPPIGEVRFDTHRSPVAVRASITNVDVDAARVLVDSPQALLALQNSAPEALRQAGTRAVAVTVACALTGAGIAGLAVFRGWRRRLQTILTGLGLLLALGATTALTFDPGRLQQPIFTGLLDRFPYLASATGGVADRLEGYRSGLADVVQGVTTLYATTDGLPVLRADAGDVVTVLHVSDLHLNPLGYDLVGELAEQFDVDAVVDTGDTTTWGTPVESGFLEPIGSLQVPYVFVRGNHDSALTQIAVSRFDNAVVLDDATAEVAGLRFAGIGDPRFSPQEGNAGLGKDRVEAAGRRLAGTIADWDAAHPDDPVDVALIHDPTRLAAVIDVGVPLVLAGHMHSRSLDDQESTRVRIEGSTGGAGITSTGLERLRDGVPLAQTASVLYFARTGEQAGRLLAYDEVTVGGFGSASVSIQRTVLDPLGAPAGDQGTDEAPPSPASTSSSAP